VKLIDQFNDFLNDTVNLNETRFKALEDSIEAIKDAVRASDWEPHIREWKPQGSWAHKTIIKPVDQGEFDADLLVLVDPVAGWSASKYIEELYNAFRENSTYKDKVRRWSHCATITYANDRKIDVAPCVVNRGGVFRLEVCNRNTDEFERSEPIKYTDWLIQQNGYSGSNSFRKVTRLIKYLRDIKGTFGLPLLGIVFRFRQFGDVERGVAQGDQCPALGQFDRLGKWTVPRHDLDDIVPATKSKAPDRSGAPCLPLTYIRPTATIPILPRTS